MITIATAYADFMNIHGDYANVEVLKRRLECAGHEVVIKRFSMGDDFDLTGCDFLYFGSGTNSAMQAALYDIRNSGDTIRGFLGFGGIVLATGSSAAFFAQSVIPKDGTAESGLAIGDYDVTVTGKRRYSEFIMTTPLVEQEVIGSLNNTLTITESALPMFSIIGSSETKQTATVEGYMKDGMYITGLGGPLLVRNPALLDYFAALLCGGELPPCAEPWEVYAATGYRDVVAELRKVCAKRR